MDTVLTKDPWKRNCSYLLDILDNQGFMASDLGEEDEDTIAFIRAMLGEATSEECEPSADDVSAAQIKEAIEAFRILQFSGNAINQIVEGLKGSMEHGTWRDDKGMRLKDTNEWALFYTTFKNAGEASKTLNENKHLIFAATYLRDAAKEAWFPLNVIYRHKPGTHGFDAIEKLSAALYKAEGRATAIEDQPARRIPTAIEALQVIANLPTGRNEDEMNGQESAYRAVESLFLSSPRIEALTPAKQAEGQQQ